MGTDTGNNLRYYISVFFALIVFLLGFYALVLYEFALAELIQGAFISFMTLAAQFVFAEAQGASQARRAQRSFDSGLASSPATTTTTTASGADTVTVAEEPVTGAPARG